MTISEKYLEELPINPHEAAMKIIKDMAQALNLRISAFDKFKTIVPLYAILLELAPRFKGEVNLDKEIEFSDDVETNIERIRIFASTFRTQLNKAIEKTRMAEELASISSIRETFRAHLGEEFFYSFSDGEIKLIQEKINNMRSLIGQSKYLESDHKERLLKRLERLQIELHKKMSNLDRFWGMVGEAGVVLGKFGKDVKPLVSEIKDLANIVWRAQSRSEGIEYKSVGPLLEKINDDNS